MATGHGTQDAESALPEPKPPRTVPTEIVHQIVSLVVASFVDELIAGPLALRVEGSSWDYTGCTEKWIEIEEVQRINERFGRTCPNPVVLLLSVSHQLRHVTLKTISTALEIPYSEGGIGSLVGSAKPWDIISGMRMYSWRITHTSHLPAYREHSPGGPRNPPVIDFYSSLTVLWHKVSMTRVCADDSKHVEHRKTALLLNVGKIDGWARCAVESLCQCPEAFQTLLRPRVADAIAHARIAEMYAAIQCYLDYSWTNVLVWYNHVVERSDAAAAPGWKAEYEPSIGHILSGLLHFLETILQRDKLLRDAVEEMPPTRPVDEMVGHANYLKFLNTVTEIADWRAEGDMSESCKSAARVLQTMFKERLEALPPCQSICSQQTDGSRNTGELPDSSANDSVA